MKKNIVFLLLSLVAVACTSQLDPVTLEYGGQKSFSVVIKDVFSMETKAKLDGLKVVFDNEDKIAVFDKNTALSEYQYSSENAKFAGTSSASGEAMQAVYAMYPYSSAIVCDGNTLTSSFPSEQQYVVNSFSPDSHIMFSKSDELTEELEFSNMCSYIRLELYGEGVTVRDIELTTLKSGQFVSGPFSIDTGSSVLTMSDGGSQSVTLSCMNENGVGVELGDSENTTFFYIAVPGQDYSDGFKITVTDVFGRKFRKSASTPLELLPNHIKPMEALEVNMDAEIEIIDKEGEYYVTADPVENKFPIEKFLKWAYLVNHYDYTLGIELTGDVEMPAFEIEPDPENNTYRITDRPITVTDGVPSGSNWKPLGKGSSSSDLSTSFKGIIDGKNNSIKGLYINDESTIGVGLVGWFSDGIIRDLTIEDSAIHGNDYIGAVVGYNRYNTVIENVSIVNSHISGNDYVGGLVGDLYRRLKDSSQTYELMPYIVKCSTDLNTSIKGGDIVGGICGYSYGAAIVSCINNADVTGISDVGGVVGSHREYNKTRVNSYIVASGSSEKATVTATNGRAGGVLGSSISDPNGHPLAISYVVGCYSLSEVSSDAKTSLVGSTHTVNCHIIASWAKADNTTNKAVAGSGTIISTSHFEGPSNMGEAFVNEMNSAIDNYNQNVQDDQPSAINTVKCHYKWKYNAGSWPTLEAVTAP